jgi:hypothetical protein
MASYLSYTLPVKHVHPRLWTTQGTVSSIKARCQSDSLWYDWYLAMATWAQNHVNDSDSTFASLDSEYMMALAFQGLLTSGNSGHITRAINYALYLSSATLPTSVGTMRRQIASMAFVYDWCYSVLTTTQRATIRETGSSSLIVRCNQIRGVSTREYIWGFSGEHNNAVLLGLAAILSDSDNASTNTTVQTYFEDALDAWDDGTDYCFSKAFRYFGADGGTCKGSQSFGYIPLHEEYMQRQFPALRTAVNVDWRTIDGDWYKKWIDWIWWHWRSDGAAGGMGHGQNDGQRLYHFSVYTQAHTLLLMDWLGPNDAWGVRAYKLHQLIESQNDTKIWGPYHIYRVFFARPDLTWPSATETKVRYGTAVGDYSSSTKLKIFRPANKACYHSHWEAANYGPATSVTISGQRWTGGHSQRDLGHYEITHNGQPLLVMHGAYNPNDYSYAFQYVQSNGTILSPNTGHTWSYYKRDISKNVLRIWDQNEQNEIPDYSVRPGNTSGAFGVRTYNNSGGYTEYISYTGGMLWPKDLANNKQWCWDIPMFISGTSTNFPNSPWYWETMPFYEENSMYAYVVVDCTKAYYSEKCQRYKRHMMIVKSNQLGAGHNELIIVWDDVTSHIDSVRGAQTVTSQLQTLYAPTFPAAGKILTTGPRGVLYTRVLSPSAYSTRTVAGWKDVDDGINDGIHHAVEYPASKTGNYDDSKSGYVFRTEVWPTAAGTGPWWSQSFLFVHYPDDVPFYESTVPAVTQYEDSTYFGVKIQVPGVVRPWYALMKKGDSHGATLYQDIPPPPPPTKPSAPSGLKATAGNGDVFIDWNDNAETDLYLYNIYGRHKPSGGVWSAFSFLHYVGKIGGSPPNSEWTHGSLTNGDSYQYYVTAVNEDNVESDPSPYSNEATPADPPPPPPPDPDPGPVNDNRRLSQAHLWTVCGIPAPTSAGVLDEGDKAHFENFYSGFNYQPPPIDYSIGMPIEDVVDEEVPDGPDGGVCISPPPGTSGTPIESSQPTTPDAGEEIPDEPQ